MDTLTLWMFQYEVLAAILLPVPILIWSIFGLAYITGEPFDNAYSTWEMLRLCLLYIMVPILYFITVNLIMFLITQ